MKTKSKKSATRRATNTKASKSNKLHHRAHAHAKTHFTRYFAGLAILTLVLSLSLLGTTEARGRSQTGTVKIAAYWLNCKYSNNKFRGAVWNENRERWESCKVSKGSKTNLYVYGAAGKCNGKKTSTNDSVDLGRSRNIKCEPGSYTFYLRDSEKLSFNCGRSTCTANKSITAHVKAGTSQSFKLGSNRR